MIYSIELSKAAPNEPLPDGSEKLESSEDLYRIRLGDYRVIYQVLRKKLLISVIKIGHRRELYC